MGATPPRQLWPRLSNLFREQHVAGGLSSLAGLARPAILDVAFNVGPASGNVTPTFVATTDSPGREEVGLLGPVTLRLSLQRLASLVVTADAATLVTEAKAVGGLKKPDRWAPFDNQAQVIVTNLNANWYVCGWVYVPLWYVKRAVFDALRDELQGLLPEPASQAKGWV